jgi:hypothetical protein
MAYKGQGSVDATGELDGSAGKKPEKMEADD